MLRKAQGRAETGAKVTETVANTEVIAKATQEVTNETMSLAQWLYGRVRDED